MPYFVLRSGEDGISIHQMDEAGLHKAITPDKDGYTHYGSELVFLGSVPETDKGCWHGVSEDAVLVIKGEIIVPVAVQSVTKYKLK
jgi:hypothetical protein